MEIFYRYNSDTYIHGFIIADSHANIVKCRTLSMQNPTKI